MKKKEELDEIIICEECGWFGYEIEFENNKCPNCYKTLDGDMKSGCSSKHINYIRKTHGVGIEQAKRIAIKQSIKKEVKLAKTVKELKQQVLRILDYI